MKPIKQSQHLQDTHYELRGKLSRAADALLSRGESIMKLHLGNPGLFNLNAPQPILDHINDNLVPAQAYCDSRGLPLARQAILDHWHAKGLPETDMNHVFIGNGVSELINICLQALLNPGDTILLPQPVYPLWSAAATACGGKVDYYPCREENGWLPTLADIENSITEHTRAITIINPNNPTGAVFPKQLLRDIGQLAAQHNLVVFADEIYSDIVYPSTSGFHYLANECPDALTITFHGLSKNFLLAGYRCAWMVFSGQLEHADCYIDGINKLLSMRLCASVPAQYAIPAALSDPKYTLLNQYPEMITKKDNVIARLNTIKGLHCHVPDGAFYAYPSWDPSVVSWDEDISWILDFLEQHHILLAPGSTFAQPDNRHFRLVLLPSEAELLRFCDKLEEFIQNR